MSNYETLKDMFDTTKFIYAVLSNVKKKSVATYKKVEIKPVELKGEHYIQFAYYYTEKVIHENHLPHQAVETAQWLVEGYFKQAMFYTVDADYHVLSSKKGLFKIKQGTATKKAINRAHNQVKKYPIEEGEPVDFLVRLGIMDESGTVHKSKYAKFRQINKYLEFIEQAISQIDTRQTINIIDFGCGKAYLTFALYYYLKLKLELSISIVGLDLKADVINHLNQIKMQLGYQEISFLQGSIGGYQTDIKPNIVISLHACDTATDHAIHKAISWGAEVIMAVPCCQHEALGQIANAQQGLMLSHGIVADKLAALVTDSIRAQLLVAMGYKTDIIEFIDMEHTPKNQMIRAYKKGEFDQTAYDEYLSFSKYWGVDLTLGRLLK